MTVKRVLIVGYGVAGRALAADIEKRGYEVVGYLDDNAAGDGVLGKLRDADRVIVTHGVECVYFAMPSVPAEVLRNFLEGLRSDDVDIAVVPGSVEVLARETVRIEDLTDVDVLDLVGRRPVKDDVMAAREFFRGKRVLVTGAAGSIGSRLVRQLAAMDVDSVICVDWWENGMFLLREEHADKPQMVFHVADIKNEARMEGILARHSPHAVFHAAAYKHVPLMEENPSEAILNNVHGTRRLMELSVEHCVANFVYVSTDKAVNPVNVMGSTKRLGEIILEKLAHQQETTKFNAVRFGNVIQSNGSVMEIFRRQIAKAEPLTVTHPDVTRYFMTIDEASQLILQSAFVGKAGEIYVLDMGEPVRILDLANSLIRAVGHEAGLKISGLRPGEKLFEELSYEPGKVARTTNAKIFTTSDSSDQSDRPIFDEVDELIDEARRPDASRLDCIEALQTLGFNVR